MLPVRLQSPQDGQTQPGRASGRQHRPMHQACLPCSSTVPLISGLSTLQVLLLTGRLGKATSLLTGLGGQLERSFAPSQGRGHRRKWITAALSSLWSRDHETRWKRNHSLEPRNSAMPQPACSTSGETERPQRLCKEWGSQRHLYYN